MKTEAVQASSKQLFMSARGMLFGLALQYILGMLLALFSSEAESERTLFDTIIFALHGLIGLGLVIGSLRIFLTSKSETPLVKRTGMLGLVSILLAFVGGIFTIAFKETASELSSLLMAVTFLSAFASYGYLLFILRQKN